MVALTKNARRLMSIRGEIMRHLAKPYSMVVLALTAVTLSLSAGSANAAVTYCDTSTVTGCPGAISLSFTINHTDTLLKAVYSDAANADFAAATGSSGQNAANVNAALQVWFGISLTTVGGGHCGDLGSFCTTGAGNSGTSSLLGNVFGVHFGNNFIGFLFSMSFNDFQISGLPNGVSNIYAFNGAVTPIPAAAWLFGSGLAVLGFVGRKRKKGDSPSA